MPPAGDGSPASGSLTRRSKRVTRWLFPYRFYIEFFVCLVAGALLSLIDRTDANWDLQNYHLYAPFALIEGRLGLDYFPAGFQAYLNPLADVPYFLAHEVTFPHAPRLVALCAGLPFGLVVFCVLRLASALVGDGWLAVLAALIGVTGATTLSEVGTTFGDIVTADLILPAVLVLIGHRRHAPLGAGALAGFAVALKFTAAIYVPPMALLVAISAPGWPERARAVGAFGLAAGVCFGLGYGPWGWLLWQRFHDPVFPLLGSLFHSPWAPVISTHDARFLPRSALQWLAYPFFWIEGRSFVVSEQPLRDPRFALAYLAAIGAVTTAFGWPRRRSARPARPVVAFWWFCGTSYLIWLALFSVLRYALTLEVCTGIFMICVLRHQLGRERTRWVALALAVVCIGATKSVGWGRLGYDKPVFAGPLPRLPPRAMVFTANPPLGFAIVGLAAGDSRFVDLRTALGNAAERGLLSRLLSEGAPALLLTNAVPAAATAPLSEFGLALSTCTPIPSAMQGGIELCALQSAK